MREEEILAEKIRTLALRSKPRDLFDVWCMLNKIKINKNIRELIEKKFREVKTNKKIMICSKKEYERDLSNLLSSLPPYKQVVKELKQRLKIARFSFS